MSIFTNPNYCTVPLPQIGNLKIINFNLDMNKKFILLITIISSLLFYSCKKKVEIGSSISLGDDYQTVQNILENQNVDITDSSSDNIICGKLELLGIEWDYVNFLFEDEILKEVRANMPRRKLLEYISVRDIQNLEKKLRELCGNPYSEQWGNQFMTAYGNDSENNGCMGGVVEDVDQNLFFTRIKLVN